MFNKVAVVLITHYPKWRKGKQNINNTDKVRGDLALKTIEAALKLGCIVIVSDFRSSKSFKKELSNIKNIVLSHRRTAKRATGVRDGIKKAAKISEIKCVLLTEPEKLSLITDCLKEIVAPILEGKADIVIPKRKDLLFKQTYPEYMYESEKEGNQTFNEELKSHKLIRPEYNFDIFFGPKAFLNDKKIVSLFMKQYTFNVDHMSFPRWYFDAENLSNTNFFPVVDAIKKGFRVKSIDVPFEYANSQKLNEMGRYRHFFEEKRKMQRIAITIELLHFVSYLENYKGVRVKVSNSK